ncbi:carbohydrate ABC transporter substrate-binding protein, CUT1 family [Halobaculum gomorrense]|uniref:Carbohydrate ABC transporter substrate-binding protein, CUT1 family n=1 Tax=Halobaculum gomorrense TaxID=43928 RepID=A0A1M5U420_9EURY|nr:carbohydrate ABC transporter substrate-binding protein, CUT1 family [Halobaculum gomorrense]
MGAAASLAAAGCLGVGSSTGSGGANQLGGNVTIDWWHAMGGNLGQTVNELASEFSKQSDSVTVEPSYKGSYYETLNATTSAIKAGKPPTVAQIVDLGSRLAIDSGAFATIEDVMGDTVDWSRYHDPVIDYYTWNGKVQSLPFNSSNPILYINTDAFEAAGLDPSNPPANFAEVKRAARALVDEGVTEKGITFANVSWFPEQWFAEANETLVNHGNGRKDDPTEIHLDKPVASDIFSWWTEMYDEGLYLHAGKGGWGVASQAFQNEKTGMYISSTAGVAGTTKGAAQNGFGLETAYYPVPASTRTGVVIGGASLWMVDSVSDEKKRAATEFFNWLSEPEQQAKWHRGTGYFPITKDAVTLLEKDGWFEKNPNFRTAFEQLDDTETTQATKGFQCGPSQKVRDIVSEAYITMINSDRAVDDVLATAKGNADDALQQYIESKGN